MSVLEIAPKNEAAAFLEGVVGFVEANTFERQMLWEENQRGLRKPWVEDLQGLLWQVGQLDGDPVCVSLFKAKIDGQWIAFYHATSAIVDHPMILRWLVDNAPDDARKGDGYINRADAMNFHNVFR